MSSTISEISLLPDQTLSHAGFMTVSCSESANDFFLQEINSAACRKLQLQREAVIGAPFETIVPKALCPLFKSLLQRVCETGAAENFSYVDENGGNLYLAGTVFRFSESSLAVVFDEHTLSARNTDIVKRGKQEWEKTVDAIDDIITIQDLDMCIVRANRAAHSLFGYKFGELVGKHCFQAFYGLNKPCDNCPVIQTHADGKINRGYKYVEQIQKTFDVTGAPVYDENDNLSMVVHVARDVTDTIRQEEERKRLSAAIEHASEVVVITDKEGVIQYMNPAFTASTGYSRDEALGQNMNILNSGMQDPIFYQNMWAQLRNGEVWRGKIINKRKYGTIYTEECTISPIYDANRAISSFVAVMRDTSREESLERQLQQAIKLEAIGTLAGGIAHDFNNILSAILGYAHIAKGYEKDNTPSLYAINNIISAGDRAADLVKQILTFSRHDETVEQYKSLKIQYIIKEVLKMMRSSLPATIKLTQDIDNDCKAIIADPGQIHQVVMNLCTNARQAIGEDYGEIKVHLRERTIITPIEDTNFPALASGCYAYLEIIDNGCGMDGKTLTRIFDPFFTTKPKDHGTGLGLSVVHGIVEKHGGHIRVDSTPGEGTTFQLLFPTQQGDEEQQEVVHEPTPKGTERLLIIDDEQQITEFLGVALKRLGYHVTAFCDSIEAVRFFRKHSGEYDMVITDMTMPNMTGTELSREFLAIRPDLPIILTTGYSKGIDKEKALRIGIRGFLTKPFKKEELARTIRKVLGNG